VNLKKKNEQIAHISMNMQLHCTNLPQEFNYASNEIKKCARGGEFSFTNGVIIDYLKTHYCSLSCSYVVTNEK
jgi:hypothetical protein